MYIDSLNNPMQAAITAGASAAAMVSTARPVAQTDTDNTVRVDTTDGSTQAAQTASQQTASQTASAKEDDSAVSGYKVKDNRTPEEKKAAENERIKDAIEKMNAQLPNSEVKFGIHEKTNRVTIKILDKDTKELIKEFPPEKTLDMIAKCMELAGVLMDEKL